MKYDTYGQAYSTSDELCSLLYAKPNIDISLFKVEDPDEFNASVDVLHAELTKLERYSSQTLDVTAYDQNLQSQWHMPDEYKELDIAKWILDQCREDFELQRVGHELMLYQERDLFDLLRYLKYLVDILRKNNIVWGVGRGSSVASYVLFLLGVHKIDSIYYDLSVEEFLK